MPTSSARALLIGFTLGDALGTSVKHVDRLQIQTRYGKQGITEPPSPALVSSQTSLLLAVTSGLLDAGINASFNHQMMSIRQHLIRWFNKLDNSAQPDDATLRGIELLVSGTHWRQSGDNRATRCDIVTRSMTIGYIYATDDEARLRALTEATTRMTHRHPAAVASSIATAYLVALAVRDVPVTTYVQRLLGFCEGISDDFDRAMLRVSHVLGWGSESHALRHLGDGSRAEDALAIALYCLLRYSDDYERAVWRAANIDGNSPVVAALVGGIMGIRLGFEAIPQTWHMQLKGLLKARLNDIARQIETRQ